MADKLTDEFADIFDLHCWSRLEFALNGGDPWKVESDEVALLGSVVDAMAAIREAESGLL